MPQPTSATPDAPLAPATGYRERCALRSLARREEPAGGELADQRPTFVVAAHPGEETLACGGTIARKVAAGAQVQVAFLTSGEQSHARMLAPSAMGPLREREALASCGRLGVPPEDVHFLRCPDGQAARDTSRATRELALLLAAHPVADLVLPDRQDAHPDLAAAFRAGVAAASEARASERIVEYPFWAWRTWPFVRVQPPLPWQGMHETSDRAGVLAASVRHRFGRDFASRFAAAVPIESELQAKADALAAHASQIEHRAGDPAWWTLQDLNRGDFLRGFFRGEERFRVAPPATAGA